MLRSLRLALLFVGGTVLAAPAQETASDTLLTVDHYLDWEQFRSQISPMGSQIVYTRALGQQGRRQMGVALWIMNADGAHHRFLVKGSDARWSRGRHRHPSSRGRRAKGTQISCAGWMRRSVVAGDGA